MESKSWRKEPRKNYSNDFKLRMVELASRPGACVAQIARENGINDNVIFKWLRLWQDEGRISRRLPATVKSSPSPMMLPVEVIPEAYRRTVRYRRSHTRPPDSTATGSETISKQAAAGIPACVVGGEKRNAVEKIPAG